MFIDKPKKKKKLLVFPFWAWTKDMDESQESDLNASVLHYWKIYENVGLLAILRSNQERMAERQED